MANPPPSSARKLDPFLAITLGSTRMPGNFASVAKSYRSWEASSESTAGPPGIVFRRSEELERKNGSAFTAKVSPRVSLQAIRQRECPRRTRRSVGFVERLFEGECHPVVQFVVQGGGRYKAFMPRTSCHGVNLLRTRTLASAPQLSQLPPDVEVFSFRGRRALTFGSFRM